MKILSLFIFSLFSISLSAQNHTNDSCALALQMGGTIYHYCDDGIYEGKNKKINAGQWNSLFNQVKVEDDHLPAARSTNVRVPNDSCAVGFKYGAKNYYRCDQGLFLVENGQMKAISGTEWNQQLAQFPKPTEQVDAEEEISTGLEGCLKVGAVIECPDGKYLKSGAVTNTVQKKIFQHVRPEPLPLGPKAQSK